MSDLALRVDGIGKEYRLGVQKASYRTLRESLVDLARSPINALRGGPRAPSFWALKNVSFDVRRGEVIGIIGRNGAGKSTLLKVLSRITEPSEGSADIYGRVGSLLEVGTGFHQELTGRENVFLNGAILGMRRAEFTRKFDEIVAFAEIDKFIDTPVKHYSSGMYMRLAFAVAANLEPEILIIDEVLAVGDASFQKKCLGKMGDVARAGRTVLFVSHQMNAVRSLCSKALCLESGTVVEFASTQDVVNRYLATGRAGAVWTDADLATKNAGLSNAHFTPRLFALVDERLEPLEGSVQADARVGVLIEGDIASLHSALTIGFAVTSTGGDLLFWSLSTDGAQAGWPKLHVGRNRIVGWMPAHFLNEGDYSIDLIASLHFIDFFCEPGRNAPSLTLSVRGGLSESPFWMAARPGLNAPILRFESAD